MKALKRIVTVMMMAMALSFSVLTQPVAFGQKNDNRPPKEQPKIKEKEKPPPSNSNNDNRKKP